MSEYLSHNPSQEQAKDNLDRLDFGHYLGNTVMIGISPDAVTYQIVCWLLGRNEQEKNRTFIIAGEGDTRSVQTFREPENDSHFKPYATILSRNDHRRTLHVATTGHHTTAIMQSLLGSFTNPPQQFGVDKEYYGPEPADPETPRVSGLLNRGVGYTYGRRGTSTNYSLVTRARYSQFTERPLGTYAVPGTALAVHSYDPKVGDPQPYEGSPYLLPIQGSPETTRDYWWERLPEKHRVAIAVVSIDGLKRTYAIRNAD